MEEIKLKNNPLGIKVYAEGKPEMTENEYSLLVSAFADKMDEIFNAMVLHAPAPAPRRRSVFTLRNVCRFAVSAAAMIALIVGGGYWFSAWRIKDFSSRMLTVCAPEGQRIHTVLQDGTQVWLNGNSKMEYPVAFSGQSRCVKKLPPI